MLQYSIFAVELICSSSKAIFTTPKEKWEVLGGGNSYKEKVTAGGFHFGTILYLYVYFVLKKTQPRFTFGFAIHLERYVSRRLLIDRWMGSIQVFFLTSLTKTLDDSSEI